MINGLLFYCVPVIVAVCLIAVWGLFRARELINCWTGDLNRRTLLSHISIKKLIVRTVLTMGACLLIFIALLRPQWGTDDELTAGTGRAVLIVLDVSRSMCAQDIKPSRITHAKQKIKELLRQLKADRVGLLVFSGDALVLCPLTTDYDAFRMFLDNVAVEAVSSGTTSIGSALKKADSAFGEHDREGTRLVVLFTDGEDFGEKISASKLHVCIVGVGSGDGGPIPVYDQKGNQNGFLKDRDGQIVISRPQMQRMRELAHETGGIFIQSTGTNSNDDVMRVRRWVERFERTSFGERHRTQQREQFFWYTGGAFVLLLLGWIL